MSTPGGGHSGSTCSRRCQGRGPSSPGSRLLPTARARWAGCDAALDRIDTPLIVVLDDFQEAGTGDVRADLQSLLEQPHPSLRLVLATRSDPPIRLQRLRLAGDLVEIRAADLAFTADEARELLQPLDLAPADVEMLWSRTEGWVAALRLARAVAPGAPGPQCVSSPGSRATTAPCPTTSPPRS
jgi:LuxR family maltose regulon positive regulatory protein